MENEDSENREYEELKAAFGVVVPESKGTIVGLMIVMFCPWFMFFGFPTHA